MANHKSYSLLYNTPHNERLCGSLSTQVIYHLSLDRSFSEICADSQITTYFLKIISRPLIKSEDIIYRQQIITDFIHYPVLLNDLRELFTQFITLKQMHENQRKERYHSAGDIRSINPSGALNLLSVNAVTLKRLFMFIREIAVQLSRYSLQSFGLTLLRDSLLSHCDEEALHEILLLCDRYENLSVQQLAYRSELDDNGILSICEMLDVTDVKNPESGMNSKRFNLFKRETEMNDSSVRIHPTNTALFEQILTQPIMDISDLLECLISSIFNQYAEIAEELDFYYTALLYQRMLKRKDAVYCFPDIKTDGCFYFNELRDILLLTQSSDASCVIPNDFQPINEKNCGRLLILGGNGNGKTVFLRSFSTMLILAQAGLPVPAKDACITSYHNVTTHFSESEKEFCSGNEAGRFEQEVRELSSFIDKITPHSIAILNEIFQTTSYEEGAEGLYHILNYLSSRNVHWILVSHLTDLINLFKDADVDILYVGKDHKLLCSDG